MQILVTGSSGFIGSHLIDFLRSSGFDCIGVDINANHGYTDHVITPVPTEFALQQNYPNPFNPITTINYDLPKSAHVQLVIYDILGREVRSLINQEQQAGYYSFNWNSKDNFGRPVSAGVYFYQIRSQEFVKTKKMILLK